MQNDISVSAFKAGTFQQNTTALTMLLAAIEQRLRQGHSGYRTTKQLSFLWIKIFGGILLFLKNFWQLGFFMSQPFIEATHTGKTNTVNPYEM